VVDIAWAILSNVLTFFALWGLFSIFYPGEPKVRRSILLTFIAVGVGLCGGIINDALHALDLNHFFPVIRGERYLFGLHTSTIIFYAVTIVIWTGAVIAWFESLPGRAILVVLIAHVASFLADYLGFLLLYLL